MKLKQTVMLGALACAAMATAAYAQEPQDSRGFYLGAGIGQFNAGIDDVNDLDDAVNGWDESDTAYKIFGGYRLNRFLSFELDYMNLGKPSGAVVPGFNVDSSVDGWAPYVVGTLPLNRWLELYGRAGYYFYDADMGVTDTLDNRVTFKEDSEDFVYGAGIGANIGDKFNLRAEYERLDREGLDDADALWLNALWRF